MSVKRLLAKQYHADFWCAPLLDNVIKCARWSGNNIGIKL